MAVEALNYAMEPLLSQACNILILDEINVAVAFGLLPVETVLDLIDLKPPKMELILTSRYTDPEIIEKVDLVTKMWNKKIIMKMGTESDQH